MRLPVVGNLSRLLAWGRGAEEWNGVFSELGGAIKRTHMVQVYCALRLADRHTAPHDWSAGLLFLVPGGGTARRTVCALAAPPQLPLHSKWLYLGRRRKADPQLTGSSLRLDKEAWVNSSRQEPSTPPGGGRRG